MTSAVCTLFEGTYHYGLAALVNSLHKAGFRGTVYAGYRGELPPWAKEAKEIVQPGWHRADSLDIQPGLQIVFLSLSTDHHLTNYKADFMLALVDGPARSEDALFYLDPDICVVCPWRFIEEWVSCGVALCEDVNSPLAERHPRRIGWRRYFGVHGIDLTFKAPEYVNGGFVGVRSEDRAFLLAWKKTMDLMGEVIGSLSIALTVNSAYRSTGFADCFDRTDQDALNAAVEAWIGPVSVIGQEAMAFKPGAALVPHALGSGKPWQRNYFLHAMRGRSPRLADKAFWANALAPVAAYRGWHVALKRLEITLAAAIGRFLRRA
jgi:hypothetical protein